MLIISLCRKLLLEPWLQIRPGELSIRPIQHVSCCKEPLPRKAFESIGHIRVSSGVSPVICPCQIFDFLDKYDCRDCILGFLAPEFRYLRLIHSESEHSLGSGWDILQHLAILILVEVDLNVVIFRHPSCLERMFT